MSDSSGDGFASPACSLHEVDDVYLGYFTRADIIARLAALRAAAQKLTTAPDAAVRAAAAAWTVSLTAQLARLDAAGAPAPDITEAASRAGLASLLDALMPKVRDDALHAALRGIRQALAALPAF